MPDEISVFREHLKEKGMRNTPERDTIIEEIFSGLEHFDVDGLYLKMRQTHANAVSKASIYRTIPLLIEAGLISEVFHEDGHMHYERVFGRDQHCHLRCNKCRKIIEFSDTRIDMAEAEIGKKFKFKTQGYKLEIFGLCSNCARQ